MAIALVAAIAGAMVERYAFEDDPFRSTTIAEHEAWVLIAAPVNHDGYRDVGDSLRAALIRELSGSYLALPDTKSLCTGRRVESTIAS